MVLHINVYLYQYFGFIKKSITILKIVISPAHPPFFINSVFIGDINSYQSSQSNIQSKCYEKYSKKQSP